MTESWLWKSAADLGRGISAGTIDPRDLTETYLAAIAAHPDAKRIYARATPERARTEADAARSRARAGTRRHPLDGVPLSWKDLVDTAGTATGADDADSWWETIEERQEAFNKQVETWFEENPFPYSGTEKPAASKNETESD